MNMFVRGILTVVISVGVIFMGYLVVKTFLWLIELIDSYKRR